VTITARIGVSSLMPLATFAAELGRVGIEVLEILPDPSDHPYAGHVLYVRAPRMGRTALRLLIGEAKVAALSYLNTSAETATPALAA
jgi:hypothetical protein